VLAHRHGGGLGLTESGLPNWWFCGRGRTTYHGHEKNEYICWVRGACVFKGFDFPSSTSSSQWYLLRHSSAQRLWL